MVKLVVTFSLTEGSDADVSEEEFHRSCLRKAYRLPALRKVEVAKAVAHLQGDAAYQRIVELYFDTQTDAHRALQSKAGQALVQCLAASVVADLTLTMCRVE